MRQRIGLKTAAAQVALARAYDPGITLKAFTITEEDASTRILRRLDFELTGVAEDADAGEVWAWRM